MGPRWNQNQLAHIHTIDADFICGRERANQYLCRKHNNRIQLMILMMFPPHYHHQMTEYIKLPSTSINPQLDPHRFHHFLVFPTMAALSNIIQPCVVPGTSATTKDMAATWPPSPSRSRLQYRPSPATCMDQAGEVSDLHERVKSGHVYSCLVLKFNLSFGTNVILWSLFIFSIQPSVLWG